MVFKKLLRKIYSFSYGNVNKFRVAALLYIANTLNVVGVKLVILSRKFVRARLGRVQRDCVGWRIESLEKLHSSIKHEIKMQKKEFPHFLYFGGFPYQALDMVNIFGARPTEIRYAQYGLDDMIGKDDRILDIGANCGFMVVYAAFRSGCRAVCIDHNQYMLNIGRHTAEYLGVEDNIEWSDARFQDFVPTEPFSVVFSFAAHWTDDEGYRVSLDTHLKRIHSMMAKNGVLVFESHTADIGNEQFYRDMKAMRHHYSWEGSKLLEDGTRELFIMRKLDLSSKKRRAIP